jgi:hypothetical protein
MTLTDNHKAKLLDALRADGVDNWEGYQGENYQATMQEIEAEERFEENKKRLEPLFAIIETNIDVDYPSIREAGARTSLSENGISEIVKFISTNFFPKV